MRHAELVFDGQCGFCTRCLGWLTRLDRRHRIRVHAYQAPGVLDRFQLTAAEAAESVWLFDGSRRLAGAAAVAGALDAALGVRFFEPLVALPLVRQASQAAYRWVAANRHRLRGTTPWCESR